MITAVDTNVLLDIALEDVVDQERSAPSLITNRAFTSSLRKRGQGGRIVISFFRGSHFFDTADHFFARFDRLKLSRETLKQ